MIDWECEALGDTKSMRLNLWCVHLKKLCLVLDPWIGEDQNKLLMSRLDVWS